MPPQHTAADLVKLRTQFLQLPIAAAAAIVLIHGLPKDPAEAEFRFILTVIYFAAFIALLYSMTAPRSQYMRQLFAWRYEESGVAMKQASTLFLSSLDRLANVVCGVIGAFVVFNALHILSLWPALNDLQALDSLLTWGWWLSLLGLVLIPVAGANLFSETFQRYRFLTESVEVAAVRPREFNKLVEAAKQDEEVHEAVELSGDHRFRAGGFDWEWEDFYKNAVTFGMTGTGKTVCVLNALLDGLLGSSQAGEYPCSGLILDPKGDFLDKIHTVCGKHGRTRDLLVLDPYNLDRSVRWNPFDSDDDEVELSARFGAVAECVGVKSSGGEDAFWVTSAQKFVRYAISLLRLSDPDEPPNFAEINSLAVSMKAVSERFDRIDNDDPRQDQALSYFANEWFELADNTRSSILAYITNMVDPFLMYPYDELFSGRSTTRIADMLDRGQILYVHMPIADKELMSRVICTFVKLEYFREVLKRPKKKRTSFFFCDEFQQFFTTMQGKGDADFFERSRQSRHANVIATQNLPGLLKASHDKESVVKNLLGNCAVKIFLRNTDDQTNQYASELFGKELMRLLGSSMGAAQGRFSIGGSSSQSSSSQFENRIRPEEFVKLGVPSFTDGIDYADTIVHLASRGEVAEHRMRWKVHPLD
jgi:type IV secretory pathway TraG/TraD family ATPase VirD4